MRKNLKIFSILFIPILMLSSFGIINNNPKLSQEDKLHNKAVSGEYQIEQVALSTNSYESIGVIINDGTNDQLYMWGYNYNGQLGDGGNETKTNPQIVDVDGDGNPYNEGQLSNLTIGNQHTGIVVDSKDIYVWGDNSSGQLGVEGGGNINKPVKMNAFGSDVTVDQLSFFGDLSTAIINQPDGTKELYYWGYEEWTSSYDYKPTLLNVNDEEVLLFDNLGYGMLILTTDGSTTNFWGIGDNSAGQLGLGRIAYCKTPILIASDLNIAADVNITAISGNFLSSAISVEVSPGVEQIYATGSNHYGQLGDSTTINADTFQPVNIPPGNVSQLDLEFYQSSSAVVNDELYTWGNGTNGQLSQGNNTITNPVPTKVNTDDLFSSDETIVDVITGGHSLLVLTTDGKNQRIYGSGSNSNNVIGVDDESINVLTLGRYQTYNPTIDSSSVSQANLTDTSIDIAYNFEMNGANASEVQLLDSDLNVVQSENITDNPELLTGVFAINDLEPGTEYLYYVQVIYTRPSSPGFVNDEKVATTFTTSSITSNVNPTLKIKNSSSTTTSASFEVTNVTFGHDENNIAYHFTSYIVYDNDHNQIPSTDITNIDNIYTINNLSPNQTYSGWTVETTFESPTNQAIITNYLKPFSTLPATVVNPTIGTLTNTGTTLNSASFSAALNYGTTSFDVPWTIYSYEVQDETDVTWTDTEFSSITGSGLNFTINNLQPATLYHDWKLVIVFQSEDNDDGPNGDGKITVIAPIEDFTTESNSDQPLITINELGTTPTSATFDVEITNYGLDSSGEPWKFESATLYQGSSVYNDYQQNEDGTWTIFNLEENLVYNDFTFICQFWNGVSGGETTTVETTIPSFYTLQSKLPQSTIKVKKVTSGAANFTVKTDYGLTPSGVNWEIDNYLVKDETDTEVSDITNNGGGSFTANNLSPGTTYNWTVEITYIDPITLAKTNQTIAIESFKTNSAMYRYIVFAIIGISVLILIFVLLFIFVF